MNIAACYRTLIDGKRLQCSMDLACTKAGGRRGEHISTYALREQAATNT